MIIADAPIFPHGLALGHRITACRRDDVRALMAAAIAGSTPPIALATLNLQILRLAAESPDLRQALAGCDHVFADGWPILALARRAGTKLPERVTGSDLTPRAFLWAAEHGWRVGVVGGDDEQRLHLRERLPPAQRATLVGHWSPRYALGATHDPALAEQIAATGVDILLVALGAPKQEEWIRTNFSATRARVAMTVGGSIDMLVGRVHRAPLWVQRLHLEFLFRCLQEPRRLAGRYWQDFWYYQTVRRSG